MKTEYRELWRKHNNLYFYWVALSQLETVRINEYIEMFEEQGSDFIEFINSDLDFHWEYHKMVIRKKS